MFDASVLEVFVASPGDVAEERAAVETVLRAWNSDNSKARQLMLKPVRWEKDATPQLGVTGGQDAINRQLVTPGDVCIAIFGKRFGSPTKESASGTAEEIQRFVSAKKPVLLYFFEDPATQSDSESDQAKAVAEFRTSMEALGLYGTFKSIDEFQLLLRSHLEKTLQDFRPLLVPASNALAYGYFSGFVDTLYGFIRDGKVSLPDCDITLTFEKACIMIAQPESLDGATDDAVVNLKRKCAEVSLLGLGGGRRAFELYISKAIGKRLQSAKGQKKELAVKALDIYDFPTPLISLNNFIANLERNLISTASSGLGYWEEQKVVQYDAFFSYLKKLIDQKGLGQGVCSIANFPYRNSPDFTLPVGACREA
jgi:hypothetical protein